MDQSGNAQSVIVSPSFHSPERSFSSQKTPIIVFTSLMLPSFTQFNS